MTARTLYGLYLLVVLGIGGFIVYQFSRRTTLDPEEHEDLYRIFERHPIKPPILEMQTITWLPRFRVTFAGKSDYDYAMSHGLIDRLNERIRNRFYDTEFPVKLTVQYRWSK